MTLRVRLVLICTGLIFYRLAFPGGGVPLFAFIAMLPLIISSHHSKPVTAFLLGLLFGTAIWSWCTWWLIPAIALVAYTSGWLLLPLFILFCLFYALPYAVYSLVIAKYRLANSLFGTFISTGLLTLLIVFYPHILPGNLVHGLYQQTGFIQIVDTGGIPLLFFIVILINALLANALLNVKQSKRQASLATGMSLLIVMTAIIYSHIRLDAIHAETRDRSITVGVVQPNIPISWRDDGVDHKHDIYQRLTELSATLKQDDPDIDVIIWPEIPTPFSYNENDGDRDFIETLQQELQTDILFSSGYVYTDEQQDTYYNTAQHLSDGKLTSYYKQILLPFGEYLPFKQSLPWLDDLFYNALNYVPGNEFQYFNLKENIKAMPLVCYEAVFSDFVADGITQDTDLLVNLVDDAWFGESAAAEIHFALSAFRTIEHRIPMIRVTNTGISAIIHRDGTISKLDKTLNVDRVFSETLSL